jgi:hypothetical protein
MPLLVLAALLLVPASRAAEEKLQLPPECFLEPRRICKFLLPRIVTEVETRVQRHQDLAYEGSQHKIVLADAGEDPRDPNTHFQAPICNLATGSTRSTPS